MCSFNKTEAAIFPKQAMIPEDFFQIDKLRKRTDIL